MHQVKNKLKLKNVIFSKDNLKENMIHLPLQSKVQNAQNIKNTWIWLE